MARQRYIRFSTPEQAKGDSLRRQLAASERYCREHSLDLDTELDLTDPGVVITSPPYIWVRDYGVVGQIGHEDTVEEYVQRLVAVFDEVRRVLHPEGVST